MIAVRHIYQPADEDECETIMSFLKDGWELASHSIYYVKKTMMISLIFTRNCKPEDCKYCKFCKKP